MKSAVLRMTVLVACGSIFSVGGVGAQTADTSAGSDTLEEITVTAEKRSENLEKTPLAITAVTQQTLETLGITSAETLSQVVPNLTVGENGFGSQVGIRGAISTNILEQGDPAVSFDVDGVYLSRQRSALTALYDIADIEVLRGPQGTLYGKNAIAGAINIITNKPDLDKDAAEGTIQYGNYNEFLAGGMLNLPVSSTFGLRTAFQSERHNGYSDNAPGLDQNDLDAISGRVEGLWKPTQSFSALLSLDYFHNGGSGGGAYVDGAPLGLYAVSAGATPYHYAAPAAQDFQNELADGATLTLNWKLPLFAVTYVGNIRADNYQGAGAISAQGPIVNTFATGLCPTATSPTCIQMHLLSEAHQSSHELRLSDESDWLKWVVGLYYFNERDSFFDGVYPFNNNNFTQATNWPYLGEATHSVFGQATWSLTKALRLTGGVRYNDDFKGNVGAQYNGPTGVYALVGDSCPLCTFAAAQYASLRFHKTTWKGGLDYDLTPNSFLFASVSTGFKSGGYNRGVVPTVPAYLPEDMLDYELGWKNELLDHRLQINVDVFHELYSNYQSTAADDVNGILQQFTVNAGKAEIDGVELETLALVTPLDRVGLNATLMHAYFDSFALPHGDSFDQNAPESLAGKNVPYAPHETVQLSYQHTFELANGASIVPRMDASYAGAQDYDYHNYPALHQGAYTRTDLSLTYNHIRTWSAQLWVRNLENKAVLVTGQLDPSVPPQLEGLVGKQGWYLPPRTYGVKLTAHFL